MIGNPDVSVVIPLYNNKRYISEALDSALEQGACTVEIIVVDDGSTDGGADIVAAYAENHSEIELIRQANQGVAAARNHALNLATGTYIAFLDSDDALRPGALADMVYLANHWHADLVIGESRNVYTFGTTRQWRSVALSEKQIIEREDPDLIYNFSNCNKLFRRSVIEEHVLRYKPLKHCEDGLFLYEFLSFCGRITGYPRWMYEYRKRMAIDARSALKSISSSSFNDVVTVIDSIGTTTATWSEPFRREMTIRLLRVLVIDECYRRLWTNTDELCNVIAAYVAKYRNRLDRSAWGEIVTAEHDLRLGEGLPSKEQIANHPLVSVVILDHMPEDTYRDCITTLYWQLAPNFEVLVSDAYRSATPADIAVLPNFSFIDSNKGLGEILPHCKGAYVQLVYEGCVYDDTTLRTMINYMYKDEADFVSVPPRAYKDGVPHSLKTLDDVFAQKTINACLTDSDLDADCAAKDTLLSNKLFTNDALVGLLADNAQADVAQLARLAYESLDGQRHSGGAIGVTTDVEPLRDPATDGFTPETHAQKSPALSAADRQALSVRRKSYTFWSHAAPVDKKRVLLISNERDRLDGDFLAVQSEFASRGYEVEQILSPTKKISHSRKQEMRLGKELATSGIVIYENEHEAIDHLSLRKHQKLVQLDSLRGVVKKTERTRRAEAKEVDANNLMGIPRTDAFCDRDHVEKVRAQYRNKYPQLANKKIVLIAPASRGATPSAATYAYDRLDLLKLHEKLGDEYVFVLKWDAALSARLEGARRFADGWRPWRGWESYRTDKERLSDNLIEMTAEDSIADLLMTADVLVTDYSPIVFEYALTGKPIVYFWYDLNDFLLKHSGGFDTKKYTYGAIAYSSANLATAIARGDLHEDKRSAFIDTYLSGCDGTSSKRAVDWILDSNS